MTSNCSFYPLLWILPHPLVFFSSFSVHPFPPPLSGAAATAPPFITRLRLRSVTATALWSGRTRMLGRWFTPVLNAKSWLRPVAAAEADVRPPANALTSTVRPSPLSVSHVLPTRRWGHVAQKGLIVHLLGRMDAVCCLSDGIGPAPHFKNMSDCPLLPLRGHCHQRLLFSCCLVVVSFCHRPPLLSAGVTVSTCFFVFVPPPPNKTCLVLALDERTSQLVGN